MQQDYAIQIVLDDVLLNEEIGFAFNHEDAFLFAFFYVVVLNLGLPRVLASQGNIGLAVLLNVVGHDLGGAAFFD